MKHLFQSLLLLMALLLPATATAHDFYVDGIYYNINGTTVTVTYKGTNSWSHYTYSGTVIIPSTVTYNGTTYSVTSINDYAFHGCTSLTSVTIPNSVTTIGGNAFATCYRLASVTIGNSVTTIGDSVFYECHDLTSVTIPNSVTIIGDRAFYHCSGLTSVTIGNSVTTIGDNAFEGCSGLMSLTIPNSVATIGDYAFWSCSGLTSVTIPNSVTSIGEFVFRECSGLKRVIVESGNPKYDSRDNCNAIIETQSNTLICGCENTVIPNSVTTICYGAFYGCCNLANIEIPNSVTSIEDYAFYNCGLTSVSIPYSVTFIGWEAFSRCALTSVTIPNSVTTIYNTAFRQNHSLSCVTIPNSVTYIGSCAFEDCSLNDVYSFITDLSTVMCDDDVFGVRFGWAEENINFSARTLHVLPGMASVYQADSNWNWYFGSIVEMGPMVATSIELEQSAAVMTIGESLQLRAKLQPIEAIYNDVAWSSSNAAVATVDDNGLVTAHGVGMATITAMTTDGSNLSASCVVTVKSLSATECLSMPDGEVLHGEAITIPVRMTNAATVLAFQTDIFLPEGFTIDTNEDNEPIVTPSRRLTDDHIIMTQVANNGAVRVVCYTPTMQPISGNEGDLFYITVNVPADAAGDYAVYLRNSRLTIDDFTEVRIPDAGAVIDVKTYIPGDVNDTHSVNVADIVTTVRYVLDMDPSPFIFDAADMNGDGEVTVTDIMLIARQILYPTMTAPRHAPVLSVNGDRMSGEGITLSAGETRTVSINLDNALDYSAFQLDLRLPEGLSATNFRLTERAASHALEVNTLRNGSIRALCYTPAIEAIDGNSGAVLMFDVTATGTVTGDITVDDIELVTTACQGVHFDAFTIGVQTATAVTELSSGKTVAKVEYFNLAGQRLTRPATGVTLIVTTYTDGTRTTTKRQQHNEQ